MTNYTYFTYNAGWVLEIRDEETGQLVDKFESYDYPGAEAELNNLAEEWIAKRYIEEAQKDG